MFPITVRIISSEGEQGLVMIKYTQIIHLYSRIFHDFPLKKQKQSGWWFHPIPKICISQLGWVFPTEWENHLKVMFQENHQPD